MDVGPGVTGTVERFHRRPNELVQRTTGPDGSTVLNGYNGEVCWEMHNGVASLLTGATADVLRRAASFYDGLLPVEAAKALANGSTLGEVRLGADTTYAISISGVTLEAAKAGGLPIAYISKSTGLLDSVSVGGGNKAFHVQQTFGAYRDFGGLLVATQTESTTHTATVEMTQSVTIQEIRWDGVPNAVFELPEAVRSLIKP
jgi:hypothetical protein